MLQKKPADRFENPAEVFDALEPFVSDDVPPPDPAWIPEAPARVAVARTATPSASAPRVSGSTSQILAAAMRGGSGTTSASAVRRQRAESGESSGNTDKMAITPSQQKPASGSLSQTDAAALDETQRTPGPQSPSPAPANPASTPGTPPPFNPTTIIAGLSAALILALVGIVILLLRD